MLAARSRREAKQGLRRGAVVAVHREQEATERVYRTRGILGRRRSRAVARPSTRASHPFRAGCGYSGFLPFTVRLSRLAPASIVARKTIRIVNRPRNAFLSPARPMPTCLQKTFRLPGPELAFVDAVQVGDQRQNGRESRPSLRNAARALSRSSNQSDRAGFADCANDTKRRVWKILFHTSR
jgi:hypothetical protein